MNTSDAKLARHADKIEAAYAELNKHDANRVEPMMTLAEELAAGRKAFTSSGKGDDSAFGVWLDKKGVVLNANVRAALIKMANHPKETRAFLAEGDNYRLTNPAYIWDKMLKAGVVKRTKASKQTDAADSDDTISEEVEDDDDIDHDAKPLDADEAEDIASEITKLGHRTWGADSLGPWPVDPHRLALAEHGRGADFNAAIDLFYWLETYIDYRLKMKGN